MGQRVERSVILGLGADPAERARAMKRSHADRFRCAACDGTFYGHTSSVGLPVYDGAGGVHVQVHDDCFDRYERERDRMAIEAHLDPPTALYRHHFFPPPITSSVRRSAARKRNAPGP